MAANSVDAGQAKPVYPRAVPELLKVADNIWCVDRPLRFLGFQVGTRMTVVRIEDALWVHSPVELDDGLKQELDALGSVRWVVAPNRYHHLFVSSFAGAYPKAALYCCPGLQSKRPDVQFSGELTSAADEWSAHIDCTLVGGAPIFNELLFCHRESGSLIATDMITNMGRIEDHAPTRWLFKLDGAYNKLAAPRTFKYLATRDRTKVKTAVDTMLDWQFDRAIMAHGSIVDSGAKPAVTSAFDWL